MIPHFVPADLGGQKPPNHPFLAPNWRQSPEALAVASAAENSVAKLSRSQEDLNERLAKLGPTANNIECDQLARIQRHLFGVRKLRLSELLREGIISDATYRRLNQQLNERLIAVECELQEQKPSTPLPME